jgi:hypothetical protein
MHCQKEAQVAVWHAASAVKTQSVTKPHYPFISCDGAVDSTHAESVFNHF